MAVLSGNTGPTKSTSTPRPTVDGPIEPNLPKRKFPGNTGPMKPSSEAIAKLSGNVGGKIRGRERAALVHRRNAIRQGLKRTGKPSKAQMNKIRLGAMKFKQSK